MRLPFSRLDTDHIYRIYQVAAPTFINLKYVFLSD